MEDGRLLFDFHSFPLRIREVTDMPQQSRLSADQPGDIFGRSVDRDRVNYEYLDGRTRKRKEKIDHFQNDPNCGLFLISLKAGGVGLNLTAAEYVFILDPWCNPAAEAQAIDRTHRIGQTQRVFAYRLICRDTVEEKILALQDNKRKLAEAIISADNSMMSRLTTEDLQLLLS